MCGQKTIQWPRTPKEPSKQGGAKGDWTLEAEDGGPASCSEGAPGPLCAGVRSYLQGGRPAPPEAARAKSGPTRRVPCVAVEESVGVHGSLVAHWDVGSGRCTGVA